MAKENRKISPISAMHFIKMAVRFAFFTAALVLYIVNRAWETDTYFGNNTTDYIVLGIISGLFVLEMILRFFPSKFESNGCQKQFKRKFIPTEDKVPQKLSWQRTLIVIASWVALNGAIGALYFCNIIDKGILFIISLAYSVCDMICILLFCPFQVWMMKNKCCATCRIYNWDFAMMFTPLVFVMDYFTWGLAGISLILLIEWEILYHKYPERFTENTNQCLACKNCREKLCRHKKHLKKFIQMNLQFLKNLPNEDVEE